MEHKELTLPDSETLLERALRQGMTPDTAAQFFGVDKQIVHGIYLRVTNTPVILKDEQINEKVSRLIGKVLDSALYQLEWGSAETQIAIMRAFLGPMTRAAIGEGTTEFEFVRTQIDSIMQQMRDTDATPTGTPIIDLDDPR